MNASKSGLTRMAPVYFECTFFQKLDREQGRIRDRPDLVVVARKPSKMSIGRPPGFLSDLGMIGGTALMSTAFATRLVPCRQDNARLCRRRSNGRYGLRP